MKNRTDDLRRFWSPKTLDDAKFMVAGRCAQADQTWDDVAQSNHLKAFLRDNTPDAGSNVVDFGCGIGRMSRALSIMGCGVKAVDVSPQMLEYAKDYCSGTEVAFNLGDGHGCTGVGDEWADLIVTAFVFQHMPSRQCICDNLEDFHRVLRKGGRAVIQTNNRGTDNEDQPASYEGISISPEEFVQMSEKIGFNIIEVNELYNQEHGWYRIVIQK